MEAYQELEARWADFNGLDPQGMVACSSGTAALHLALESMQLPQASKVICSDFNMIAVPRAIVLAGLKPVFVDCDNNLNIDTSLVEMGGIQRDCNGPGIRWVDRNVKAIMAVHVYGRRCNMDRTTDIANHYTRAATQLDPKNTYIHVIEDLAEAHGVRPHTHTDAACWSFYKNKIVAGEEGGAVWFKDAENAQLARQLRSLGFTDAHDFTHIPRGHNYRMSNAHATLVLRSLDQYAFNKYRRSQAAMIYDQHCPREWRMPYRDVNWVYDLRISDMTSEQQNVVVRALNGVGIAARHAFKPMRRQQEWLSDRRDFDASRSDVASREVIYLPLSPAGSLYQDEERAVLAFATIKSILTKS